MQTAPGQDGPPDHGLLKRASIRGAALTFVSQAVRFAVQVVLAAVPGAHAAANSVTILVLAWALAVGA